MSSGGNRMIPGPPLPYHHELLAYPLTLCEYRLRLVVSTHFVFSFLMPGPPPGWRFARRSLLPSLPLSHPLVPCLTLTLLRKIPEQITAPPSRRPLQPLAALVPPDPQLLAQDTYGLTFSFPLRQRRLAWLQPLRDHTSPVRLTIHSIAHLFPFN